MSQNTQYLSGADLLKAGIAAVKAGERELAHQLLVQVVEQDESNIPGWLWLSGVVDTIEDRLVCLENVLALDPDNAPANKGVAALRKQQCAQWLSQGIAAVKSGERDRARELLMQVVQTDEENVSGWMWLCGVVETLEDRETCLLNVLDLDPGNETARKALSRVQTEMGARIQSYSEMDAESADQPESGPAPPPRSILAELDDELLCPYCALPTGRKAERCKQCGGQLWVKTERKRENRSILLWILIVFQGFGTLGLCLATGLALLALSSPELGEFSGSGVLAAIPIVMFMVSIGFTLGLYFRWQVVYYIMLVSSILGLLFGVIELIAALFGSYWGFELLGSELSAEMLEMMARSYVWVTVLCVFFSLLWFLAVLVLRADFSFEKARITMRVDPRAKGTSAFLSRGRRYMDQKMWALAALHFQRAVMMMPDQINGRAPLALACVKLGWYDMADQVLDEAQRIRPDDGEIQELKGLLARERRGSVAAQA